MIHGLELPIQVQDLIKAYHTSMHFRDIYHYITNGRLPSSAKAQNCIHAEALNYVVVNNFLFRIDTQKDNDRDKGNSFLLVTSETVSYTHLRAHETLRYLVCRLLLEKKK